MAETIFAPATAGGRAAVSVVRISGPAAGPVLDALAGRRPTPRHATLTRLRDPSSGAVLDRALILWFPGPASYTGQDSAELHLHGGRAVLAAVLASLARCEGCRLAEPGEFTRQALLAGKMGLSEAEGLADLIDAQTEAQRRQALRALDGDLGDWVAQQRELLLHGLASAESAIDFVDEGDVSGAFELEVRDALHALDRAITEQLARAAVGSRIRDGLVVTLAGPPNAGKSTLLNRLAQREAAIVSPHAGTTRDPVEIDLDLGGYLVHCIDTAGLRETEDPIEREGIDRARARARSADLVLWLHEASETPRFEAIPEARQVWTVATKADIASRVSAASDFTISATTGQGVGGLIDALAAFAGRDGTDGGAGLVTRLRHRRALEKAQAALRDAFQGEGGIELMAEHIRIVLQCLETLVGRIENEDVLGEIFARFCIGK